jgi:hypothetical protein
MTFHLTPEEDRVDVHNGEQMIRPELKKTHCPYLRAVLTVPDAPKWDQQAQVMNVEDLLKFVKDQPGNGNLEIVLKFFSVVNHGIGNRIQRLGRLVIGSGGQFSTVLKGSDGDHEGDSRIYNPETGEFDPEQFEKFTSFSTDGETMDVAAIGRAIADANQRHNGTPITAVQSAGEFALLGILLGDDDGKMKIPDMKRLFEANELSETARKNLGSRTAEKWVDLMRKITKAVSNAAVKAKHQENEMKPDRLEHLMEVLFSPLLRAMRS